MVKLTDDTVSASPGYTAEALASALARVCSDPGGSDRLHALFGGFCHEVRNLLNGLKMSLYLTRRAGAPPGGEAGWADVEARYAVVERFVDRFQQVCRPLKLSTVRLPVEGLFQDRCAAWADRLAARGRGLILAPPPGPTTGVFDPARWASAFDDLVGWRAAFGDPSTDLRVRWWAEGSAFAVVWEEIPAGAPRQDAVRSPPTPQERILAGLTLPLLLRIVSAHGGRLTADGADPWRLTLRWPLDARTTPHEAPPCSASPPSR